MNIQKYQDIYSQPQQFSKLNTEYSRASKEKLFVFKKKETHRNNPPFPNENSEYFVKNGFPQISKKNIKREYSNHSISGKPNYKPHVSYIGKNGQLNLNGNTKRVQTSRDEHKRGSNSISKGINCISDNNRDSSLKIDEEIKAKSSRKIDNEPKSYHIYTDRNEQRIIRDHNYFMGNIKRHHDLLKQSKSLRHHETTKLALGNLKNNEANYHGNGSRNNDNKNGQVYQPYNLMGNEKISIQHSIDFDKVQRTMDKIRQSYAKTQPNNQEQKPPSNKNIKNVKDTPKIAPNNKSNNSEVNISNYSKASYPISLQQSTPKSPLTYTQKGIEVVVNDPNGFSLIPNVIKLKPLTIKKSHSYNGDIKAYSAGTHNGIVRQYNEDRLSIVLNYKVEINKNKIKGCNFFGIYDGHGGYYAADILKSTLHKTLFTTQDFPLDIDKAIRVACLECENELLKTAEQTETIERSGSCAVFCLTFDKKLYFGNVGDSRAIMSSKRGNEITQVTIDHKPDSESETLRIKKNGGEIYKNEFKGLNAGNNPAWDHIKIPWRVVPGRLSVSRTFGDILAKKEDYGGKSGVVIAEPEVFQYDITSDLDFVIQACDGVFDRLENDFIINKIWSILNDNCFYSVHDAAEIIVNMIFEESIRLFSYDNISVIFLGFEGFSNAVKIYENNRGLVENKTNNINFQNVNWERANSNPNVANNSNQNSPYFTINNKYRLIPNSNSPRLKDEYFTENPQKTAAKKSRRVSLQKNTVFDEINSPNGNNCENNSERKMDSERIKQSQNNYDNYKYDKNDKEIITPLMIKKDVAKPVDLFRFKIHKITNPERENIYETQNYVGKRINPYHQNSANLENPKNIYAKVARNKTYIDMKG